MKSEVLTTSNAFRELSCPLSAVATWAKLQGVLTASWPCHHFPSAGHAAGGTDR